MTHVFRLLENAIEPGRFAISRRTKKKVLEKFFERVRPLPCACELKRFGPNADGGYLIPDDLDGIVCSISPGVDDKCGFDLAMAERGIKVLLVDGSVDGPAVSHPNFTFIKKFIACYNSNTTILFNDLCQQILNCNSEEELLLQMDIEGGEYDVVPGISDNIMRRFRIMVVEIHNIDQLLHPFSFRIIDKLFAKLTSLHDIVHIHPNNFGPMSRYGAFEIPSTMEFTFYRKDRNQGLDRQSPRIPHPLDFDNVSHKPPLVLPRCWR